MTFHTASHQRETADPIGSAVDVAPASGLCLADLGTERTIAGCTHPADGAVLAVITKKTITG